MRILFVGMADSVHSARWIGQLSGLGWDLHLFPVYEAEPHDDLPDITLHTFSTGRRPGLNPRVRLKGPYPLRRGSYTAGLLAGRLFPRRMAAAERLAALVRRLKPDIVHSLAMQRAAYLTLDAKALAGGDFPPWFVSSWGSDLYLFGRLAKHAEKVRAIISACDYFTADCERDLELARQYGLRGKTFPALPVAGGFDIEMAKRLRSPGPTSARRMIALKGYQDWAGRSLMGLRAIELCADVLRDYRVTVYLSTYEVEIAAELMSLRTGIPTDVFQKSPHEEVLRMQGRARVSIGINISDGLPLSTMEAALMGSFPVQSDTSCIGERLRDGVGTLLVPPDDAEQIAAAIRRAVTDDELVDRAAGANFRYIAENLSRDAVRLQVVAMYEEIYAAGRRTNPVPGAAK